MTTRKPHFYRHKCLISLLLSVFALIPIVGQSASCSVLSDNEGGSGDWNQSTRWKDGLIPNDGDDINIYSSITVTDADMPILKRGTYIVTRNTAVVLTIDIVNDHTVSGEIGGIGACIKKGTGSLTLCSAVKRDHHISGGITVESGALTLKDPCKVKLISAKHDGRVFIDSLKESIETLDIRSPGIAYLPETGNLTIGGLTGDGSLLRRESASVANQQVLFTGAADGRVFEFSGTVSPSIALTVSGSDDGRKCNQYLLNSACASTKDIRFQDGVVGVSCFGGGANPGSLGTGSVYMQCRKGVESAPTFLYLGTEAETTSRKFIFTSNPAGEMTFDAGDFGGLTLNGTFVKDSMDANWMMRLALTGSNTRNISQFAVTFKEPENASVYITKRGSGIWRFPATSADKAKYKGVFAVESGTLEYESLAEAGSWCSLGYATMLHECYSGTRDDTRTVPYAYLLGNGGRATDEDLAAFSYVGSSGVNVSSRPIALKGAARVKNASTVPFAMTGVTSAAAGRNDLVLDGPGHENALFDVTNGVGTIGVIKEGAGTWTLGGRVDVTGGIIAKAGTLNLDVPDMSRMTWFRFTVKRLASEDWPKTVLCHFGLFDAQHNDLTLGVTYHPAANGRIWALRPGQAAFATADCTTNSAANMEMNNLFKPYVKDMTARWSRNDKSPDPDKPETWPALVIRLPADAMSPVVAYDMISGWYDEVNDGVDTPFKWTPTDWILEGSVDGVHWQPVALDAKTDWTIARRGNNYWLSDATSCTGVSAGFPIATTTGEARHTMALGSLSVAPAATVSIAGPTAVSGFDVTSGAGTVTGVSFAETGTLKVTIPQTAEKRYSVPCVLQGCNGIANLKNWTLLVNGEPTTKWSFVRSSGTELIFSTGGFVIFIR